MKPDPVVSIVTPSLNQGRFLEDTIRSIRSQDYGPIEHIVCDGGSTDQTLQILERYRDHLTYTSGPDGGQAVAINEGFARARGEIITWLNSDDVYVFTNAVSAVVSVFQAFPDVDCVYGDFVEIDESNTLRKVFLRPARFSRARLLRIGYISQPATFFRARVVAALTLDPSLRYAMDLDFWLRASAAGYRFQHVPMILAAERVHHSAKSVGEAARMQAEARVVRERYGHRFGLQHRVLRTVDKAFFGLHRLRSLVTFAWLLRASRGRLAVELRRPLLPRAWLYQLGLIETLEP